MTANAAAVVTNPAYQQSNGAYTTVANAAQSYGTPNFLFVAGGSVVTPPLPLTVIITAPPSSSTVSGTVTLTAVATPAAGLTIASVQFRLNGANIGPELTTAPDSYALDTTTLANATGNLTAVATGSANISATSAAVVLTINNALAPPAAGTAFLTGAPANTSLRNDYSGYVGMELTTSATPLLVSQLGRWVATTSSQTHIVKLVNASSGLDVPGGAVSLSLSGATVGQYDYAALASPVTLLANTSYYLLMQEFAGRDKWYDLGLVRPVNSAAAVNAPELPNGVYVTASGGSSSYGPVNRILATGTTAQPLPPPTVTITSSSAGTVSGMITLTATPSNGLTISSVQFKLNGNNISSPFDTTSVANGPYTLTALATDSAGASSTSAGVAIAVSNAASSAAPLLTGSPTSSLRNDFSGYVGLKFTVGSTAIKSASWDAGVQWQWSNAHAEAGGCGDSTDVAGGSVSLSLSTATAGQYAYAALAAPLTLPANHS